MVRTDDGKVLWTASQKKLFRKYAKDRDASIVEIKQAVEQYLSTSKNSTQM